MLLCEVKKLFWAFSDSCRDTTSIPALLLELVLLCRGKGKAEPQPRETETLSTGGFLACFLEWVAWLGVFVFVWVFQVGPGWFLMKKGFCGQCPPALC